MIFMDVKQKGSRLNSIFVPAMFAMNVPMQNILKYISNLSLINFLDSVCEYSISIISTKCSSKIPIPVQTPISQVSITAM